MPRLSLLLLLLVGCVARARPAIVAEPSLGVLDAPALRMLLETERVRGLVAVLHGDSNDVQCTDLARCQHRVLPASTYKIPNALIGLETGVIADADFVIPWDGVVREIPAWNRDHNLRTAIQVSAVPYFQELARRVGAEREALWVRTLDYGNADTGSEAQVDSFWLEGPLAISPVEQLGFLRRFARAQLPVHPQNLEIVRDILVLEERDGRVLRGKTGWGRPHQPDQVGWFVGYVEHGSERSYVAVLLQPTAGQDDAAFLASRRRVAEAALRQLGAW